jgi:hypothetical protein
MTFLQKIKRAFSPIDVILIAFFIIVFVGGLVFDPRTPKKQVLQEQCQVQWTGPETAGHGDWMSRKDAQNWVDYENSMSDSHLHHSLYCTKIK